MLTVITVVYNDYHNLQKTLQSIRHQKSQNFEFIIVDGGSTDGSLDLIQAHEDLWDQFISEKDQGIYDAMNKGIRMAKGQYINFMNAGDAFYAPETLEHTLVHLKDSDTHILYGKVMKLSSENSQFYYERGKALTQKSYFLETPMCHQSMFIARSLFAEDQVGLYDLSFKAGAFYEWLAKYYSIHKSFDKLVFLDEIVSIYLDGGFSFQVKKRIQLDRLKSVRRYYSLKYICLNYVHFLVEYGKALLLPIMVKMNFLDTYRRMKYASKSMLEGSK